MRHILITLPPRCPRRFINACRRAIHPSVSRTLKAEDGSLVIDAIVPTTVVQQVLVALDKPLRTNRSASLTVLNPAAIFPHPEDERDEEDFAEDPDEDEENGAADIEEDEETTQRLARDALASDRLPPLEMLEELRSSFRADTLQFSLIAMTAIIAACGLLRDSAAIVIGAMIIAPLLMTNLGLALSVCLGDRRMLRLSLLGNLTNLVAAGLVALVLGLVLDIDPSIGELGDRGRMVPSDIPVAVAAGAGAALALSAGLSSALVGIMVAVALLPAVVAAGLFAGSGHWEAALGAVLLTAVNLIFLNLAAALTFRLRGYTRGRWIPAPDGRLSRTASLVAWTVLVLIAAALAAASVYTPGLPLPSELPIEPT